MEGILPGKLLPSRLYCRLWNFTIQVLRKQDSRTITAGRELHPAPKASIREIYRLKCIRPVARCQFLSDAARMAG